ncbi:MAG: hypothetical protein V1793_15900, partial [Pseudomonadota bacterium]
PFTIFVSIHAPAGGATNKLFKITVVDEFQSTLPQGERLGSAVGRAPYPRVSIHAPAGGATWQVCWRLWLVECFNPRSRRGSDYQTYNYQKSYTIICPFCDMNQSAPFFKT